MERKFIVTPFEVKADAQGRFTGRASVYGTTDYYGDVVDRGAFTQSLADLGGEIVVLNQHNPSDPIGKALLTDKWDALHADGQLVLDLQSAKDMYTRIKNGLVTGISIGYETIRETFVGSVRHLQQIRLLEISLVTFPANSEARVTDVKHQAQLETEGLADALAAIRDLNRACRKALDEERAADPITILDRMQTLLRDLAA